MLRERFRKSALIEAAVAFCLLLQLSSVVHFLLVRHEACVEHGEMVHVGGVDEHAVPVGRSALSTKVVAVQSGHSAGSHEHCPLVPDRASQLLIVPGSGKNALELRVAKGPRPHTTAICLSASALRLLAPKTSPPV